ncbi:bis(5'-adenosyl)-triphosphatase ENPP4-like [Dendronephthya gigantea]|uniref:bis(5'-adenosyl)-triphosphatase ENPP4-like n=1 Tax=Dendronephthya gigantea TaxID=151771 RepID=UPI00106BC6FE|nr:bis(5'-adenosyl)-triphosphatase ENPP4-like [Dendronephthya gigantea]
MGVLRYIYFISFIYFLADSRGKTSAKIFEAKSANAVSSNPRILLLSIGGLRTDYLTRINCSNIQSLAENGVSAKYVQTSINVASIANHYSMVTGLYPESHGIISQTMFDPILNRVFNSETREEPEWWSNVHPIWQEIENQGQGMGAVCRWPGVYGPMVPTLRCGQRKSFNSDIDQAAKWFKNGVKLVLLYSDDIKKAAIKWGPYSQNAIKKVMNLDSSIKYLLEKTRDLNVNILLTSDSGVTDLKWDHVIDLDKCLDPKSYVLTQAQATLLIYPKQGYTSAEIHKNLSKCPHIRAHLKSTLPDHFHYSHNRRIPPVIAFVPLGSVVRSSKPIHQSINAILNESLWLPKDLGGSGYHSGYEVMRGVFYASGPSFKAGLKYKAINNTDIYGIMCAVLGITPRANNGSIPVAKAMLRGVDFETDMDTSPTSWLSTSTTLPPTKWVKTYSRNHGLFGDFELRGFLIFLACSAAVMVLLCCIGCLHSMRKNVKGGFKRKASVYPPMLSTNLTSSDED